DAITVALDLECRGQLVCEARGFGVIGNLDTLEREAGADSGRDLLRRNRCFTGQANIIKSLLLTRQALALQALVDIVPWRRRGMRCNHDDRRYYSAQPRTHAAVESF